VLQPQCQLRHLHPAHPRKVRHNISCFVSLAWHYFGKCYRRDFVVFFFSDHGAAAPAAGAVEAAAVSVLADDREGITHEPLAENCTLLLLLFEAILIPKSFLVSLLIHCSHYVEQQGDRRCYRGRNYVL
jgi:hypothetical protein